MELLLLPGLKFSTKNKKGTSNEILE